MTRALWAVPCAAVLWYVGGVGGVVAGLVVRRLRLAVPLTVALGTGLWLLARRVQSPLPSYDEQRQVLIALLVATGLAAVLGAVGSRRSVAAAVAAGIPVAYYALLPGRRLDAWFSVTELNGFMIAIGF